MTSDINKAIENITYNHLNQSTEVNFGYFDKLSNRKPYTTAQQPAICIISKAIHFQTGETRFFMENSTVIDNTTKARALAEQGKPFFTIFH